MRATRILARLRHRQAQQRPLSTPSSSSAAPQQHCPHYPLEPGSVFRAVTARVPPDASWAWLRQLVAPLLAEMDEAAAREAAAREAAAREGEGLGEVDHVAGHAYAAMRCEPVAAEGEKPSHAGDAALPPSKAGAGAEAEAGGRCGDAEGGGERRVLLVGLHTCGDLGPALLRCFVQALLTMAILTTAVPAMAVPTMAILTTAVPTMAVPAMAVPAMATLSVSRCCSSAGVWFLEPVTICNRGCNQFVTEAATICPGAALLPARGS